MVEGLVEVGGIEGWEAGGDGDDEAIGVGLECEPEGWSCFGER